MQPGEKDLRQRTKEFALQIIRVFSELPKTTEAQVLGKQVLRSGTSVGANYREAYRARSKAEFIAKCGDSLRELEETTYWLELLRRSLVGHVAQEFPTLSSFSDIELLAVLMGSTVAFGLLALGVFSLADRTARRRGLIDRTTNY